MRNVVVQEWMSLDGVVQAPAYADEDMSGGFRHGGWHSGYFDDVSMNWVVENLAQAGGFLLGRRTYDTFAAYWPTAPEQERALAEPLNTLPKYVVSRTLKGPIAWQNARLLEGDVAAAVRTLRQLEGGDLLVIGSTGLVQTLVAHDLIDQYRLMIDPVVLSGGKRIFHDDGALRRLRLVASTVTTTGAILATYDRASFGAAK